jgi:hypothetical protein
MALNQIEYLLSVDEFNNPAYLKGKSSVALLLSRLIVLEPGSDPLHPTMGLGIKNYRFNSNSDNINELKSDLKKQIETFLPQYTGVEISMNISKNKILNVSILIGDTEYRYSTEITTDSLKAVDLNDIKNL